MKTGKRVIVIALLLVAAAVILMNCGGGGGGSDTNAANNNNTGSQSITLSGSVGSGYQTAPKVSTGFFANMLSYLGIGTPAYAALSDPLVDQVVAIPVYGGSLTAREMASSVMATINADKTFSLTLTKDRDWLLVLIDSSVTGTNRFVGSLGISTGSDSLLDLPATDATISTLDLGAVTRPTTTSNDAISATSVTGTEFSMTAAQLTTLAKADDFFRNAKNIINNYNPATRVWYQLRPDFFWRGDYAGIQNNLVTASTYTYHGYNFQFDSNSTELTMDSICGTDINGNSTTKATVELYPSGTVTTLNSMTTYTYDTNTPISNATISCGTKTENGQTIRYGTGGDFSATGYDPISYTFGMSNFGGDIPLGYWDYKVNGNLRASFDVAIAQPFAPSGLINVPVPVLKVNTTTDGSGRPGLITSVDVTWFILNDAGDAYVPLTDITILKHLIGWSDWAIESATLLNGSFNRENSSFIPATQTTIIPTQTWYYNNTDASIDPSQQAQSIQLFYEAGGRGHFFQYSSW